MSFEEVVGQDRALRMLRGILKTGRIATAYLFEGERGIGKYKTALEFAQALNCETSDGINACNKCGSCRKIRSHKHPDVLNVAPDNNLITVEQIRGIEEFLSFTPHEGSYKVVIVDDADQMNMYSENAFLKTLEEPPDRSIIILVSSRHDMLADTIRSRCLKIRFGLLNEEELFNIAGALGLSGVSSARCKLAMGRVGQMLEDEVLEKRDEALGVFEDMIEGREIPVPKDREVIGELMDYFALFLRDSAVYVYSQKGDFLINADVAERIEGICKYTDLNVIINIYEHLSDLRKRMAYNLNKSLVFNYLSTLLSSLGQKA